MSLWSDLREGIRKIILMKDRLERLGAAQTRLADAIENHERRLIRIEPMIEMAQQRRGEPKRVR